MASKSLGVGVIAIFLTVFNLAEKSEFSLLVAFTTPCRFGLGISLSLAFVFFFDS